MVINAKVKPSLARTISNTASGPLLLDFKPIQIVRTMKYLGCIISSNNKAKIFLFALKFFKKIVHSSNLEINGNNLETIGNKWK